MKNVTNRDGMINNKYRINYLEIIEHAKVENRTKGQVYYENHHIIPKSLGGSNEPHNMVLLTPEEHFKVHKLLPYFTEGLERDKMIYAWHIMSNINGKPIDYLEYAELKEAHAKVVSKQMSGKIVSEESKLKMSKSAKSRPPTSDETRKKLSIAAKNMSDQTKKKIGLANKNRKHSNETKQKIGAAQKGQDSIRRV